jgi:hypothetical protein
VPSALDLFIISHGPFHLILYARELVVIEFFPSGQNGGREKRDGRTILIIARVGPKRFWERI